MTISGITVDDVATYLRLDDAEDPQLAEVLEAAKQYVLSFTGQTADALDAFPDVAVAVLVLCQDMYDNRTMYAEKTYANRVVDTILSMYRVNFL